MRSSTYSLGLWCLILALLTACNPSETGRSQRFERVFGDESTGLFRGHQLGQELESIKDREAASLKTEDQFGLVYEINLDREGQAIIEYMSREGSPRVLQAIVVNVLLAGEEEATEFYNEAEAALRQRHGVPDGSFGQYQWKDADRDLDITLRLLSDKKSWSLNFAPLL